MRDIGKIKLTAESTIRDALVVIDSGAVKFAIVVDEEDRLIGTLTDGDIRRSLLAGKELESSIRDIYFREPTVANIRNTKKEIINICTAKKIYQVPIVDDAGKVVSIDILDELLKPEVHPNKVVLMVGGLGTRLKPLTNVTPKPMLHVGGKPILETIVENFAGYGFTNIVMCVNYKSQIIQDYFGDGSQYGVKIEYIFEENQMGTAGALSLLPEPLTDPFFVMNGDLLTKVNFEHMLDFHLSGKATATMGVREYDFQVPYGVVNIMDGQIQSIEEKPVHKFFVSAGMYILDPECIDLIPQSEFYDMPTLFEKMIALGLNTTSFPLREYWLDIGRIEEYEKANREYGQVFDA